LVNKEKNKLKAALMQFITFMTFTSAETNDLQL